MDEIESPASPPGQNSTSPVSRDLLYLIGLGIFLRLFRYLTDFPLWGDESLLASNLLWRDYSALTQPLDNGQVAPVGFLWCERLAVTTLGFHAWSLRLQGLLFGLLALILFAKVARRLLYEKEALCAIGVFAVSYFAIRYSAETKPYAGDLFFAVAWLALAAEWHATRKSRWIWGMVGLVPVSFLFSFPVLFVAGGISLGMLPFIAKNSFTPLKRSIGELVAYAAFNLAAAGMFLVLQWLILDTQYRSSSDIMTSYWKSGFPPGLDQPVQFLLWLWDAGTSSLFAVPFGGEHSGSILSSALFLIGLISLYRTKRSLLIFTTFGVASLAFIAAALRKYPIADHPRLLQYFAPFVALAVGTGLAALSSGFQSAAHTNRLNPRSIGWITISIISIAIVGRDISHPYQNIQDVAHRNFASRLWQEKPGQTTICLATNFPALIYYEHYMAAYYSYRALYTP
ncbi:MAG: glycosyltransferase family 39 protein, partial [Planctomycetaceae bacterium]|nr:glycosyltransferase family 39 protein [Planctomycetaceae bacterium]